MLNIYPPPPPHNKSLEELIERFPFWNWKTHKHWNIHIMRVSLSYSLTIDHNYISGCFFCQYNLCVQKYLLNHVISEKLSNITCTNVLPKFRRRHTHTPWNLSNEFYKTTMCCFCVFFLNNFLNFKCMPVLFISWEKKNW